MLTALGPRSDARIHPYRITRFGFGREAKQAAARWFDVAARFKYYC